MFLNCKYSRSAIFLCLICYPVLVKSFKLNEPKILLPYNKGLPSNYTLRITGSDGSGECFEWRSSRPNTVRVIPLFAENNCSKSAVLSSVGFFLEREVTEISVTQKKSGKTVYCEALTDNVNSIEFEYLSEEIFLGGSPQKISVIAKDKEGHVFSSLNGLEIKWEIISQFGETVEDPHGSNIVKLSKFDISEYEPPDGNEIEKLGLWPPTVLVEPLEVGTAIVRASLLFHGITALTTEDLELRVLPNVKISPSSSLYLIRHAKVNVTVEKLRHEDNNIEFTADVEDTSIVEFARSREVQAKEYGSTFIKIQNQDINSEIAVHVVKPARIGFRISNGNYTVLEELKLYEFYIDLFDENGNEIYASENLRLDVKFPPKLFHIIYSSPNGTYFIVQTTAPGRSKIRAEFKGVLLEDDSIAKEIKGVSSTLVVSVCQRLNLFPPYSLLPVLKEKPMHKISLTVSGGTGNYVWSLSNYDVAKIVTENLAEKNNSIDIEISEEVYELIVTVVDLGNINFIAKAQISCQVPLDLEAYPSVVEAEVGNYIILPTALLGYEDKSKDIIRKFDDCSKSLIEIEIIDAYVIAYEKEADIPAFGKGCKSLSFKCKAAGHSRINIKYNLTESISYKTTTVLSCYKPLKPVHPVRISVLPLGASMEVAFEGGPRRWPLFKEGHITEILPSDPDLVEIQLIKDAVRYNRDLTVFRVKCLSLGENTLNFQIKNKPSATLPHPAKSEASIKLLCSEPHSLHLKLFKKKSKKKLDENVVKVPFYGEKTFEVDVYVKDKLGRRFANITSLRIAWDTDDKSLTSPVSAFDFESFENAVSGYRKLTRNFKKFQMRGGTGNLKVEAKITSYRKDVLKKERIKNYKELEKEIATKIELKLVSLRDLNSDLYDGATEKKDDEGYCESDSCKT